MADQTVLEGGRKVGRKKGTRKTAMVRTYEEFAELVGQAAGERRMTVADFCEKFLTPCADKAHREYIKSESRKIDGSEG